MTTLHRIANSGITQALGFLITSAAIAATLGCSSSEPATDSPASADSARPAPNPLRNAYFGDLHVHTKFSFDAFTFGVRATPDDAYRYAKGEPLEHAGGFKLQLQTGALDFEAVTDHAVYLGVVPAMSDSNDPLYQLQLAKEVRGETGMSIREAFQRAATAFRGGELTADQIRPPGKAAWTEIIAAAERHNDPGHFTAFIGYEYTSGPDSQNLHRNVIFRGSKAPELPFSRIDSPNPEDLWAWLDARRAEGIESLAIPHNSNGSNGQMFRLATFDGKPLDADYAAIRMRNEPLVEVSQVKGTSEVHPLLSPNDEWADFEIFPYRIATTIPSEPTGSYVREALLNGIALEENQGFNPFRFGLIAATDTHNGGGTPEESNYHSKVGKMDATSQLRGSVPLDEPGPNGEVYADVYYDLWGASGLAGVWAEENTRESLYDALRRKETFATSGPRMRVRFFAGFEFADGLDADPDMVAKAYEHGVPMGADLIASGGREPRFLVWATRDARSAPLQRLQVVKGWVEGGKAKEQVFDVACSDGLVPDPTTHRCADNGARANVADCSFPENLGAAELRTLWRDPTFDPAQRSVYYVRVLENETCRWSTWDAIRAGVAPRSDRATTIQERAWSSPIWYVPPR